MVYLNFGHDDNDSVESIGSSVSSGGLLEKDMEKLMDQDLG
jgi:hypothetical protein